MRKSREKQKNIYIYILSLLHIHTAIFKTDNQQDYHKAQGTQLNIFNNLNRKRV